MTRSDWWVWAAATVILCCACARAARKPVKDPQVIIAGGGGSLPLGNVFQIVSPSGTSPLNLSGGSPCVLAGLQIPDCVFQNSTNSTWTTLTFSISPGNQTGPFLCTPLAFFSKCSFNKTGTSVTFSGGTGIRAGQDFLVVVILWLPGTTFAGSATESYDSELRAPRRRAPARRSEPSTITLFLDGHAALMDWERLRTARGSGV
jgi:hypothetical protein